MTNQVVTMYSDDLSGEPDAHPVRFGFDGREYTIDLTDANARKLALLLAPYVQAARMTNPPPVAVRKHRADDVRRWARENGYTVRDKGVIRTDIVRAYGEAHGGET